MVAGVNMAEPSVKCELGGSRVNRVAVVRREYGGCSGG